MPLFHPPTPIPLLPLLLLLPPLPLNDIMYQRSQSDMPGIRNKLQRLHDIENLLLNHPEGLRASEIARLLGVHRSTISRYKSDLPDYIKIDEHGIWKLDWDIYRVKMELNIHEALALHLASRMMATRIDKRNTHAAKALLRLGEALKEVAPLISKHIKRSARLMTGIGKKRDKKYIEHLETFTRAWAEGLKVVVYHRHLSSGKIFKYKFSPYFIEPNPVGFSIYVIGFREPPGAIRTFKLERVEKVALTMEPYKIPRDFDPVQLLQHSWGIWLSDRDPVEVVLRFLPEVSRRLEENQWYHGEKVERKDDGSIIWRAELSDYIEILPWIRSWGPYVEVLEPQDLRRMMAEEARRAYQMYH